MATQHSPKRSYSPCSRDEHPPERYHAGPTTVSPSNNNLAPIIPVRFLVMSDTHDKVPSSTPQCDVLLHCGDLTEDGSPQSISTALSALSKIDAEIKLIIAGNHEISLDKTYYLAEGGSEAAYLESRSLLLNPDIRYLEEGTHDFMLKSGAHFKIYVSSWTPIYGSSAFQYPSNEDRFNGADITPSWAKNVGKETSIIPEGVDIVMTHGPPQYVLDKTADGRSAGCEHLRRAIARVRPRLHCFGHVHAGYGAQRVWYNNTMKTSGEGEDCMVALPKEWVGKNQAKRKGYASLPPGSVEAFKKDERQTLIINAATMDGNNEPTNAPWMVELDLPNA
ncbi:hypothetical protein N0V90_008495 [Kalmusia sp. IMI 367209]|nr:hypothetical protein N0V90_008495 [Kalmusia sp. IMI 367209]